MGVSKTVPEAWPREGLKAGICHPWPAGCSWKVERARKARLLQVWDHPAD